MARICIRAAGGLTPSVDLWVAYESSPDYPDPSWMTPHPTRFFRQRGKDLGERLRHAFGKAFQHGARAAVAIGSDAPQLSCATLRRAFRLLKKKNVVLGPAEDGGYYLIGLDHLYPKIFRGISWSTEQVLQQTLFQLKAGNLSYGLLPTLWDIDTLADWQRFRSTHTSPAPDSAP